MSHVYYCELHWLQHISSHHSCEHVLKQLKKNLKHIQAWTRFPWPVCCRVLQCSYHWAIMSINYCKLVTFWVCTIPVADEDVKMDKLHFIHVCNFCVKSFSHSSSIWNFLHSFSCQWLSIVILVLTTDVCSIFSCLVVSLLLCSPLSRIF